MWAARAQVLGPLSNACPGVLIGGWISSSAARHRIRTLIAISTSNLTCYAKTPVTTGVLVILQTPVDRIKAEYEPIVMTVWITFQ